MRNILRIGIAATLLLACVVSAPSVSASPPIYQEVSFVYRPTHTMEIPCATCHVGYDQLPPSLFVVNTPNNMLNTHSLQNYWPAFDCMRLM